MIKIRAFLRGEDVQNNYHQEFIDTSKAEFPSSSFKKDPRFDRIKEKQKSKKKLISSLKKKLSAEEFELIAKNI